MTRRASMVLAVLLPLVLAWSGLVVLPSSAAAETSDEVVADLGRKLERTVTYEVITRGEITADLDEFKEQAAETFAHHNGWRTIGLAFEEVDSDGDFTLALSADSQVPSFGGACTTFYSCRSGDWVVINEDRWNDASPGWNSTGASLRDYRHMVVNHEVGHWLGHGHLGCTAGQPAPLMMQQSKGLNGCEPNPWPLKSEQHSSSLGIGRFPG